MIMLLLMISQYIIHNEVEKEIKEEVLKKNNGAEEGTDVAKQREQCKWVIALDLNRIEFIHLFEFRLFEMDFELLRDV